MKPRLYNPGKIKKMPAKKVKSILKMLAKKLHHRSTDRPHEEQESGLGVPRRNGAHPEPEILVEKESTLSDLL